LGHEFVEVFARQRIVLVLVVVLVLGRFVYPFEDEDENTKDDSQINAAVPAATYD
jgi:hypothetical protein